jgi:hypothetical protein
MPKRCALSETCEVLKLPRPNPPEHNVDLELQVPCTNCYDLNPDFLAAGKNSFYTNLAKVEASKENGCRFCGLLYETFNYYYEVGDKDWEGFRFIVELKPGEPVLIIRNRTVFVHYREINLFAPSGMFRAT